MRVAGTLATSFTRLQTFTFGVRSIIAEVYGTDVKTSEQALWQEHLYKY
jgi:hypothetical protein